MEVMKTEATPFNDAFRGSDRDWLVPVEGNNHLPAIGMTPLLMATLLTDYDESVSLPCAGNILRS